MKSCRVNFKWRDIMSNRTIYVVSDSVGETAELVVKAAISQFNGSSEQTNIRRIPMSKTAEQ